jgi:hypothetical protein
MKPQGGLDVRDGVGNRRVIMRHVIAFHPGWRRLPAAKS